MSDAKLRVSAVVSTCDPNNQTNAFYFTGSTKFAFPYKPRNKAKLKGKQRSGAQEGAPEHGPSSFRRVVPSYRVILGTGF